MTGNSPASLPLVIDIDGTLLATDTLYETFWAGLGQAPMRMVRAVLGGLTHRSRLKARMVDVIQPEVAVLPVRAEVQQRIDEARASGRPVYLASGADQRLVDSLAARLGLPGPHFGSTPGCNLTGRIKADALVAHFGPKGFDYIGDSTADIPVWLAARQGIVVAPSAVLRTAISKAGLNLDVISIRQTGFALLRALRPHQWVKNILMLMPVLAAHRFDAGTIGAVLLGMVAFSAAASAIYIVNDLLDLAADRQHSEKRHRPFAAGTAQIPHGMLASLGLAILALGIAALLNWQLAGLIAVYMALSLAYSLRLKRLRWVDVFMLATLYTLRVVAGSLAGGLALSGWLANFIFPVFLALGCVKRLTELAGAKPGTALAGRGYRSEDRGDLLNIALAGLAAATAIFVMYSYSGIADNLYEQTWLLRLAALIIPLWLGRMIARGWQGRMNHDPIVFALRDLPGLGLLAVAMSLVLVAAGLI